MKRNSYHTLCVAVPSAHRQVEPERVGINDIDITGFRTSQGVDASVEWLVGAHLNGDSGVLAVHGH